MTGRRGRMRGAGILGGPVGRGTVPGFGGTMIGVADFDPGGARGGCGAGGGGGCGAGRGGGGGGALDGIGAAIDGIGVAIDAVVTVAVVAVAVAVTVVVWPRCAPSGIGCTESAAAVC
mmetsp:Transcript_5287/g.9713  ORF Transcript_5287/g.9713 Transcript_5287/m.9713 type:complete len:118 (-) Transcript_5287:75-428(-)